jgi:hypothetical protein
VGCSCTRGWCLRLRRFRPTHLDRMGAALLADLSAATLPLGRPMAEQNIVVDGVVGETSFARPRARAAGYLKLACFSHVVASLSRPGGNVTGVTQLVQEVAPKLLELLHKLLPTARVMALLVNPADPVLAESRRAQHK